MIEIPPQLLTRYGTALPRYNCYPSAIHWDHPPTEVQWFESLDAALQRQPGLALYVHLPFCASLCTFCGCHVRIVRNHALAGPYIDLILKEWALYQERLGPRAASIAQLYLGGGTPTFLLPDDLDRLLQGLLNGCSPTAAAEYTVEADPRNTTTAQLDVLARYGFRQISFGVQDMDPRVQDIVNRTLEESLLQRVMDASRERGFQSVSIDLIYGLPLQTADSLRQTLQSIERTRPDRIAFYPYAHVPWIKPGQRRYTEADLPDPEQRQALQLLGRQGMAQLGYQEVGLDQFALVTDSLAKQAGRLHRNLMGYTTSHSSALIGLGVSAMGSSGTHLVQNEKSHILYEQRLAQGHLPVQRGHALSEADRTLQQHIYSVQTHRETVWTDADLYCKMKVEAKLFPLEQDGLVQLKGHRVSVTALGLPFLRNICACFDGRS